MEAYRSKFGRRYDRKFKEKAVALVQSGRTVSEVARDLGVSQWSLNRNGFNVSFPRADNPGITKAGRKRQLLLERTSLPCLGQASV
jgi:transposase-like protein